MRIAYEQRQEKKDRHHKIASCVHANVLDAPPVSKHTFIRFVYGGLHFSSAARKACCSHADMRLGHSGVLRLTSRGREKMIECFHSLPIHPPDSCWNQEGNVEQIGVFWCRLSPSGIMRLPRTLSTLAVSFSWLLLSAFSGVVLLLLNKKEEIEINKSKGQATLAVDKTSTGRGLF